MRGCASHASQPAKDLPDSPYFFEDNTRKDGHEAHDGLQVRLYGIRFLLILWSKMNTPSPWNRKSSQQPNRQLPIFPRLYNLFLRHSRIFQLQLKHLLHVEAIFWGWCEIEVVRSFAKRSRAKRGFLPSRRSWSPRVFSKNWHQYTGRAQLSGP